MAEKVRVANIAGVGIIYRGRNPHQLFMEVKDDGHPIKLVRRQLSFIGGNWIGEAGKSDRDTLGTFRRELGEELSFERPVRTSVELALLGLADIEKFAPTPDQAARVTQKDIAALKSLKETIARSTSPFGDFLLTVPKSALDAADPANTRDGYTSLCSYWEVGLGEKDWKLLTTLQEKFKNLSNESITLITSLDEIIQTDTKTALGHDRVLQEFFLKQGFKNAENLPLVPNLKAVAVGPPLASYGEYLKRYEVAHHP